MITRLTNTNLDKYTKLWEKASNDLTDKAKWDNEDAGKGNITSIKQYFHYIKDLADIDLKYLMLPADEDIIDIDANTREINVRNSIFSTAGIGVQDDQIAETIFFRIDRYFDATDLYPLSILFHWKTADGTEGVTRNFCKDIESEEGKIIFGWPIANEITEHPGKIQFAVRFYSIDGDNVTYNFGTKIASLTINPSMKFDQALLDQNNEGKDWSIAIKNRLTNSTLGELVIADIPEYITYLFNEGSEYFKGNQLGIIGYSPDINDKGEISYSWRLKESGKEDEPARILGEGEPMDISLALLRDDEPYHSGLIYYKKNSEGKEEVISLDKTTYDGLGDTKSAIYVKGNVYTIPENAQNILGNYFVVISNKVTYAPKVATANTKTVTVKGPSELIFQQGGNLPENPQQLIDDKLRLEVLIENNGGAESFDTYQWKRVLAVDESGNPTETEDLINGTNNFYEFEPTQENEGKYYVIITRTKNNNSITRDSRVCQTYLFPTTPIITSPTDIFDNDYLYTNTSYHFEANNNSDNEKYRGTLSYVLSGEDEKTQGIKIQKNEAFDYTFTIAGNYSLKVTNTKQLNSKSTTKTFNVLTKPSN